MTIAQTRRIMWSNFLGLLVGKGKPVSVTLLDAKLAEAKRRRSGADDRKTIYDQLHYRHAPSAINAWLVGEALRDCGIAWSSGFLALYACDRLRDVCGVLGRLRPDDFSADNVERLASLIQTNIAATYVSPLDLDHDGFSELELPGENSEEFFAQEISRNDDQEAARAVWTLESDIASILRLGWERWLADKKTPLPFELQQAFRVSTSGNATFLVRESSVRRYLMQWLYTKIHPEPPSFSESMLYEAMVKAPDSNLANLGRLHLLSQYYSIQEELSDPVWTGNDIPESIANRLKMIREFAPEILTDEDPLSWLPYDDYDLGIDPTDGEVNAHEQTDDSPGER